jgi:2-dehydropantoate 2-reductase
MGAGAIGCYLGGCLQATGTPVVFVGRPRVLDELRRHGLHLTDLDGGDHRIAAADLVLHEAVPAGLRPAWVLLAVKSAATTAAARELAPMLAPGTLVVSMQNGVSNADVARAAAPALEVLAGMVPFNVARLGPGHFHRGTDGALAAQDHPVLRDGAALFARSGLALELHADLRGIQWAKLLLNLNNPVNALSGLPLKAELQDRDFRRCLAALQQEGLAALAAAGIAPAQLSPLPARWLPAVLRLPTPIFRRIAARMLRIDEKARSSMAEDFALGRPTEIDALCGEVVRLAERHGLRAPVNRKTIERIEAWPTEPRAYSGAELRAALGV